MCEYNEMIMCINIINNNESNDIIIIIININV